MDVKQFMADLFTGSARKTGDMIANCRAVLGSLPIVAHGLVASAGKPVAVLQGTRHAPLGATDGETIYLMDMPIPSDETDVETFVLMLTLSYGLVHHEVGHVNHTTFPLPEQVRRDALLKHLLNIIEDVRQENVHIGAVPGAKRYLDALNAALQVTGHLTPVSEKDSPVKALTGWLLYRLYWEYRHDPTMEDLSNQADTVIRTVLDASVVDDIEALLPRMQALESSDDALDLAIDIKAVLVQANEDQQAQDEQQEDASQSTKSGQQSETAEEQQGSSQDGSEGSEAGSDEGNDSQEAQGSSSTEGSDDDTTQEQGSSAGNQASSDDDSTEGGQGQKHQSLADIVNGVDADTAYGDHGDMANEALEDTTQEVMSEGASDVVEMTGDHLETGAVGSDDKALSHSTAVPTFDRQQALSATSQLRTKLSREMQALIEGEVQVGKRGRKLATSRLSRVGCGDHRVFRARDEDLEVDTAIVVAVDVSSSMGWKNNPAIKLAASACYATVRALESIEGVNVAVTTFPGYQPIKSFGVRSRMCDQRFNLIADGSTPMAEGITMATRMLMATPEPRKVMVVMTDGVPNSWEQTRVALEAARFQGMEIFGLGIGTDAGRSLFEKWRELADIGSLPITLINLLRGKLLDKAA